MTSQHAAVLDDSRRERLLDIARRAIGRALAEGRMPQFDDAHAHDVALRAPGAAFVTLLRDEQLLGCVGSLQPIEPLAQAVHRAALQAAFADPRVPAVTIDDFEVMTIKASVLSALEAVPARSWSELTAQVRPGVDGLLLDAAGHRATLLPSVWEQCPEPHSFLGALWNKAGLPAGVWPSATHVQRYTTDEFASYGPRSFDPSEPASRPA